MTFTIPENLAPENYPMAWLLGSWRGAGLLEYPGIDATGFIHELHIDNDDEGPYLRLNSTIWLATDDPAVVDQEVPGGRMAAELTRGQLWSAHTGFVRVSPTAKPVDGQYALEATTASGAGHATTWAGVIRGPQARFAADLLTAAPTATPIQGEQIVLGLVESDLFYSVDMAAFGEDMRSYFSGRLSRIQERGE